MSLLEPLSAFVLICCVLAIAGTPRRTHPVTLLLYVTGLTMLAGQLSKTYGLKSVTDNESQFVFDKSTYSDKNIKNNNCENIMNI